SFKLRRNYFVVETKIIIHGRNFQDTVEKAPIQSQFHNKRFSN
ncbi:unnamed protein product, partial [Tenebrio molitor]